MLRVAAYQHGIYPRSEAVVAATRDWDRGRTTWPAVDEAFATDLAALVAGQQEAGLDYYSDGLLRWQDLFRPLVDAAEGMEATSIVRWFDTNSFFRMPLIDGTVRLDGAPAVALEGASTVPDPRVATLPSPYLFSRAAETGRDRDAVMTDLARRVLRPAAETFAARGWQLLHLEEPWLGFYGLDSGSWEAFAEAVAAITEGLSLTTVLHVSYGDASRLADRLPELAVDVVGVDALATDLDALGPRWPTGLLLGALEGRNTLLEPVDATADAVARLAETLQPTSLYLSANSGLGLLPSATAGDKLRRLGAIKSQVEERLS